jgi:hypothetical protein
MESLFCSFGMFIVDRIVHADSSVQDDVLGGAGLYAVSC